MLISIITPSFNSAQFIEQTYKSISAQTYQDWEWLITDDLSIDNSWEIISRLASNDERIKAVRNKENSGAAVSRNNAIARAKGDFLAFLDSDDIWLPDKLERHIAFMQSNNADLSFTPYSLIDEHGVPMKRYVDMRCHGQYTYLDMLKKRATMGCCTVMVRVGAFSDLSMPLIRAGQDYALWLKLLKFCKTAHIFTEPLSQYRIVSNSLSRNKYKKALKVWEIYRDIEQLSLLKASYVFSHYAIRALLRLNETEQ